MDMRTYVLTLTEYIREEGENSQRDACSDGLVSDPYRRGCPTREADAKIRRVPYVPNRNILGECPPEYSTREIFAPNNQDASTN